MAWYDDLGALRAWASTARPVFICGQERSGTSALLLAMSRHPALFPVPDVFETFIFRFAGDLLKDPPRKMQQGYLRGEESLYALRSQLALLAGGDPARLADDDLVRAFFAFAAHGVYPGRRPLEKTPSHVHSLPRIFSVFPQARVLACVREPTEVVDSYRKRLAREQALGKPPEAWKWLQLTDQQLIEQFRRVDKALRESVAFAPGRVFQVPYGWLTADPRAALSQICQFLDEPFDEAMLVPKAGRKDRVDERLGQPLSATGDSRASTLTEAQAAKIAWDTGRLTRRWRVPGPVQPEADPPQAAGAARA